MDIKQICVFCASSSEINILYIEAATRLGQLLAENNVVCITGAGNQGLMGAVNDSVHRHGGKTCGIIPQFMVDSGWLHPELSEIVVTETMHERKALMASRADAFIVLPGGFGTLEELAEIVTWRQLDLHDKPIIILNINGYYDQLLAFFEKMIREKFMDERFRKTWQVADTPEEVILALRLCPM